MSGNSNTEPPKGILKHMEPVQKRKTGVDCPVMTGLPQARFDEMNILQTHHPENKDYGHMKIDEPKTPYHTYTEEDEPDQPGKVKRASFSNDNDGPVDPKALSNQLNAKKVTPLKSSVPLESTDEEEQERAKEFKAQRAAFYKKEFVKKGDIPEEP